MILLEFLTGLGPAVVGLLVAAVAAAAVFALVRN
jgi:hypothetical protein